jgi:hypothetical protein
MVFILTQEYNTTIGNAPARDILDLQGYTNYRIIKDENGEYNVYIVYGEQSNALFKVPSEKECVTIMQNILTYHAKHENHIICDINAFLIPEVNPEGTTVEELHDLILEVAELHGYDELVSLYEHKLEELETNLSEDPNFQSIMNTVEKLDKGIAPLGELKL